MKKTTYFAGLFLFFAALGIFSCYAQTSTTAYFMESYSYRYMMNPALVPSKGFVSIPALGNLQADVSYNFGLENILYPTSNGGLMTFMHPSVDANQFLDGLQDMNSFSQNLNIGILNLGFFVGKSFFNFGINAHQDVSFCIPKELFACMKKGQQSTKGTAYEIKNLNMNANAYVDVSLGTSVPIFENIRVGGRLKLLLGVASANVNMNRCRIETGEDSWSVESDIEATVYGNGLDLSVNEDNSPFLVNFNMPTNPKLSGMGFAVDLGATYTPVENLNVSLAVTNLGFMSWKKEYAEKVYSKGITSFSGFDNLTVDNMGDEMKNLSETLEKKLSEMYEFKEAESTENGKGKLGTTITAGLEYGFLKNRLSAGLLYNNTAVACGDNVNDFTISANLRFIDALHFSASYTFSNYGGGFGAALNVAQVFFISCDCYGFEISPQGIPLKKASPSLSIGLNIPIGGGKDAKRDLKRVGYFGSFPEIFGWQKTDTKKIGIDEPDTDGGNL